MIENRLVNDFKNAMKDKNIIKKNTVQQLRAQILLAKKDNNNITDRDIEDIIMKERNKRLEALVQFEKANRQDLVEQTNKELLYINEYLPQPMSEQEIINAVKDIMLKENITEMKLMGYAIKKCKEAFGNRANGKQISDVVKQFLEEVNEK
jgi:uncharacterized protein YqeY